MPNFKARSTAAELMDAPDIPYPEFHHCLRSLEIINVLTLAYRPTLRWLKQFPLKKSHCVIDVGSGGGDMLRRIENLGRGAALIGVDLNPLARQSALVSTPPAMAIDYETADIFAFAPNQPPDFIICSLFTHHLTDAQLIEYLRWVDARAGRGWFVNDLHRHPLPYYFIKIMTFLFSRNRLIRHDAAISVARAFTFGDWRRLLAAAGIGDRARMGWYFPFRICVSCRTN